MPSFIFLKKIQKKKKKKKKRVKMSAAVAINTFNDDDELVFYVPFNII